MLSMNKRKTQGQSKFNRLVRLDEKIKQLPKLSPVEQKLLETEQRFESVYYSNKLEGNKLSKDEAKKAVMLD